MSQLSRLKVLEDEMRSPKRIGVFHVYPGDPEAEIPRGYGLVIKHSYREAVIPQRPRLDVEGNT